MKRIVSTLTSKGQTTIPIEVRRTLGISPSDKIVFLINDNGSVQIRPIEYTLEELRGILPPLPERATPDLDDLIEEAMAADTEILTRGLSSH